MNELDCPSCGSEAVYLLYTDLVKCEDCGFIFEEDEPEEVPTVHRTRPRRSDYDLDD